MSETSETVALANKVLDLLEKGAKEVGQTASTAFPYVVRYEWAQALSGVGIGVVFLGVSIASVFGFLRSDKKRNALRLAGRSGGEEVLVVWALVIAVTALISVAFLSVNIPVLIEPTGHTIEQLLRMAK